MEDLSEDKSEEDKIEEKENEKFKLEDISENDISEEIIINEDICINFNNEDENKKKNDSKMMEEMINNKKIDENELEKKRMGSDERQLYNELEEKDDTESKDLNQIAKIVLDRISDKLNGSDFNKSEELKILIIIKKIILKRKIKKKMKII